MTIMKNGQKLVKSGNYRQAVGVESAEPNAISPGNLLGAPAVLPVRRRCSQALTFCGTSNPGLNL